MENILEKIMMETIESYGLDYLYEKVFISMNKEQEEEIDYINKFIEYYKIMKEINNLLNKMIYKYGYPEEIKVQFNIKNEIKCLLINGNITKEYKSEKLINYL